MNLMYEIPNFIWQCAFSLIRENESKIAGFLRKKIYKTYCSIDTNVIITNHANFKAGKRSSLYHSCYILNKFGIFKIGENSHLGAFCYVNVCYGKITIGDDVAIGPGTKLFAYSNHYTKGKKVTDEKIVGDIIIGSNVFIGANCTILPNTVIQDNVIVAAGAVVKGVLEKNSIYGGVPCKLIQNGWYE